MLSPSWCIYVLVALFISHCAAVDLPDYIKFCNQDDIGLHECLKNNIQGCLKGISKGIPEIGFPSIDPFIEEEIHMEYLNNQIKAKVSLMNVTTHGISDSTIGNVRAQVDDDVFKLEVDMVQPYLLTTGEYRAEGHYNYLHIDAKGDFNATMSDIRFTWKLEGVPQVRDGVRYVNITKFNMRPYITNMTFYASDLFPDNPEFSALALKVANDNWRIIYLEVLPVTEKNWEKNGMKVANAFFQKVPYDQIFPSS